ncbi:hypothetical protein FTX61_23925, partial [Nitriliruptoraceae bacterium ZYF776]|nr:hypothetical protein [Profundirhabdus halotolerans]
PAPPCTAIAHPTIFILFLLFIMALSPNFLSHTNRTLTYRVTVCLCVYLESPRINNKNKIKMVGWAIAVHGGAGVDPNLPTERQEEAKQLLTRCLNLGISALRSSASAIDVVELVVRELESDPIFNSGRGSALTENGTVEMEASIMDGQGRRCGAVSGLTTVKNPVSLARLVMDKSPHSYLGFSGAEDFAKQMGVEREENDYFITQDNVG